MDVLSWMHPCVVVVDVVVVTVLIVLILMQVIG